ncbi:MAG: hypothetical protein U9O41_04055 [Candidatus Aerophobetes bacterium]|nr:hypothetical protein [Candidatus Aerophobetes bacterium]
MKELDKTPKNRYQIKLLREFDLLKLKEAIQEVLEYTRFVKEEEKKLLNIRCQQNIPFIKTK